MAVMVPKETLTDQRLGDLDKRVARVEGDIRELRGDVKDLRREMSERFESLNRSLIGAAVAVVVALIGSNATLIGLAVF